MQPTIKPHFYEAFCVWGGNSLQGTVEIISGYHDTKGSSCCGQWAVCFKVRFRGEVAFMPSIQFINDPALNPAKNSLWAFGLRARVAL